MFLGEDHWALKNGLMESILNRGKLIFALDKIMRNEIASSTLECMYTRGRAAMYDYSERN